jgi:hypothetical protein
MGMNYVKKDENDSRKRYKKEIIDSKIWASMDLSTKWRVNLFQQ